MSPEVNRLNWVVKDAARGYWHVTAESRGEVPAESRGEVPSEKEPDYFETVWQVRVTTDSSNPGYAIEFTISTQYDQPLGLPQIAREIHTHVMLMYDAAITAV